MDEMMNEQSETQNLDRKKAQSSGLEQQQAAFTCLVDFLTLNKTSMQMRRRADLLHVTFLGAV